VRYFVKPIMNSSPHILCLGNATIDRVYHLAAPPQLAEKQVALDAVQTGGGKAANAAVAIARLGGRATFLGCVGDDELGSAIVDGLVEEGVITRHIPRVAGATSSHSVVLVDARGERTIINVPACGISSDPAWLPLAQVGACQAVLADIRWVNGCIALAQVAHAAKVPVILDIDPTSSDAPTQEWAGVIALADYAIFSRRGLAHFSGTGDTTKALKLALSAGARMACVTNGAHGAWWMSQNDFTPQHVPAFAVRATDTLGAGDVFHGAFALAIAGGEPMQDALLYAAAAAAVKVQRNGGRAGYPRDEEVRAMLSAPPSRAVVNS
jgi:sulfofructose kinase